MNVQVHCHGLEQSPWTEQFLASRVQKLRRYVNGSATVYVHIHAENRSYFTTLSIHYVNHEYDFNCDGQNLYEAFTGALDKATKAMSEHRRLIRDRIHRRHPSMRDVA